jgi:hypothetical protein
LRGRAGVGGDRDAGPGSYRFVARRHPPPHAAKSIFVKYKNRAALSSPSRGEEAKTER